MREALERDEATPVLPVAVPPAPEARPPAPEALPPQPPAGVPPPEPSARFGTLWRLAVAACAGSLAATVVGLAGPSDRHRFEAAATAPSPPVPAPTPAASPAEPGPPARTTPRRSPRAAAEPPRAASAAAPPAGRSLVAAARAHYLAGDIRAARAAVAGATEPEAGALAARLGAIARLVGAGDRWPPPGGAPTLERLLELDAAVAGEGASPLAARARVALADHLVAKGRSLADEGRWEEALGAFREAAARHPDHPGAAAGLARVEAAAESLYLEGYAVEETDLATAGRLYRRAARLARPDGSLAPRIAARLGPTPRR